MTEAKHISQSLMTLLIHPIVQDILDKSCNIELSASVCQAFWMYDLMKRKPGPAHNETGAFVGTDLDLATFLYALQGRKAIINIPVYKAIRQTRVRENQELTSKYDRNGEIISVGSNKDFFSFNVQIMDQNVVGEEKVGDYRTFSLTDFTGEWYDGWREINFVPTIKENRFITENKLWTGNKIIFSNFIHPNRWTSFFGHHYVISKLMIDRLTEEASYLNREIKAIQEEGIYFPKGKGPRTYDYSHKGETKPMSFPKFEVKIYIPSLQFKGEFPKIERSQKALIEAYQKRKRLMRYIKDLRFSCRAAEYAHYKAQDRFPVWIKNVSWEDGFVEPGKRTKWSRLKLFQPQVGQRAVSILKRETTKSTQVDINY